MSTISRLNHLIHYFSYQTRPKRELEAARGSERDRERHHLEKMTPTELAMFVERQREREERMIGE